MGIRGDKINGQLSLFGKLLGFDDLVLKEKIESFVDNNILRKEKIW
jgi:hypothetical protein